MAEEVGKGWVWEAAQWWGFRAGKKNGRITDGARQEC